MYLGLAHRQAQAHNFYVTLDLSPEATQAAWDAAKLREEMPEVFDDVQRLIDRNFASSLFASPHEIEAEMQARLARVTRPMLVLPAGVNAPREIVKPPSSSAFIDD